jgi:hypothetical protein
VSRNLPHLARRFFSVLRARPLRPGEQAAAARLLRPTERALFWGQRPADQRHGLECAAAVLIRRPDRPDLARAALLHDIGKRQAALGALGRALATTLGFLRVPVAGRFAAYLGHGRAGAADLEAAGAEALIVSFACHHHDGRPADVPADDWVELCRADHARKAPAELPAAIP